MNAIPVGLKHSFQFEGAEIRIYHAKKGEGLPRHEHIYSHATAVHNGSLKVTKENFEMIMTKDSPPILLKENEWHELEALEDGTVFMNVMGIDKY